MNALHHQRRLAARQFLAAQGDAERPRLTLMHPQFNLREVAKQMILLEDHLCHPYKHCPDCIRKHLMTIEAFAEEAVSLDQVGVYRATAENLAVCARIWIQNFHDHRPTPEIAQEIREIRKELVRLVADPREAVSRVAARHLAATTLCIHQRPATIG